MAACVMSDYPYCPACKHAHIKYPVDTAGEPDMLYECDLSDVVKENSNG